jgi:gluconolactonase
MEIKIIAEGLRFPEGPVVLDDGSVIIVEIEAGRVTRVKPDGTKQVIATPGGGPNGAALGPDGALYVCNNGGFAWAELGELLIPGNQADDYSGGRIERIDLATGKVERLYDSVTAVDGQRYGLRGPNDIVFDPAGGFWFTDLGKIRRREVDHGGLYYAKADGSQILEAVHPLDHPNGIGLSPDGQTLYVAQTGHRNLLAFKVLGPGRLSPVPPESFFPGQPVATFPGRTLLDSLAVTADGDVCVATLLENAGIAEVNPASGSIHYRAFPDLLTTNIAFGGPDMMDAWVTLSTTGKLAKVRWGKPGLKLVHQR